MGENDNSVAFLYTASSNFLLSPFSSALYRHPSYVGWFLWSVGTQVLLKNPLCCLAYSVVSWRFFRERIFEEEHTLINFFGDDYLEYQERVGTGLPGVKGLLLDEDQKAFIKRKWARKREAEKGDRAL